MHPVNYLVITKRSTKVFATIKDCVEGALDPKNHCFSAIYCDKKTTVLRKFSKTAYYESTRPTSPIAVSLVLLPGSFHAFFLSRPGFTPRGVHLRSIQTLHRRGPYAADFEPASHEVFLEHDSPIVDFPAPNRTQDIGQ